MNATCSKQPCVVPGHVRQYSAQLQTQAERSGRATGHLVWLLAFAGDAKRPHAFRSLDRCPISSGNDTHEEVKTQRRMLCKDSGESDRKTNSLHLFLLSVDMRCCVVCFLSSAVTLHNTPQLDVVTFGSRKQHSIFRKSHESVEDCIYDVNDRGTSRNLGR